MGNLSDSPASTVVIDIAPEGEKWVMTEDDSKPWAYLLDWSARSAAYHRVLFAMNSGKRAVVYLWGGGFGPTRLFDSSEDRDPSVILAGATDRPGRALGR